MSKKLASMKISDADRKKQQKEFESSYAEHDKYPYGLNIGLEQMSLDKLSMEKLPSVGDEMILTAKVSVTSVSQRETKTGPGHKRVELQITDMGLEKEEKPRQIGDVLYGGKKS